MRQNLQVKELIRKVYDQEYNVYAKSPTKQRKCDFENVVDMLKFAEAELEGVESITLDFDVYINLSDILRAVYLKRLHKNIKNIDLNRCKSVEINNNVSTLVLTCCKSRARKINELKDYDNIKYIIYTKTYKVEALIDYEKVCGLEKPSVGYIVENAKSVKPLL